MLLSFCQSPPAKDQRGTPTVEQVAFTALTERMPPRDPWGISIRGSQKELIGFGLWLGDLAGEV